MVVPGVGEDGSGDDDPDGDDDDEDEEVFDGGPFPRLFEPEDFFVLPEDEDEDEEAEVFPVVAVDFPVVAVVLEERPVVVVVAGRRVVVVDDEEELPDDGPVVVVDDAAEAWACVTWMLRWPSLESALPSLATKLKASTSTPAGGW